jgi:hypothetical protein
MACDPVIDYLTQESGRYLADLIARRVFGQSPWLTLIRRAEFPAAMGETISRLIYERMAPVVAEPVWHDMVIEDGAEGGLCLPPAETIGVGSTTYNFNLKRRVINGPDFCAENLRPKFSLMQQLNDISGVLADYITIEWEIRDRHEYFRMCKYKVVLDQCGSSATFTDTVAQTYPAVCPGGTLDLGTLAYWRIRLFRDGAGRSALMKLNGAPQLTAITSAEVSGNILRLNPTLRQDLNYAYMGSQMGSLVLAAFGVSYALGGFVFMEDMFPRRGECNGGVFAQTAAFELKNATKGKKAEIRDAWQVAGVEESFIFDPEVFVQLVPRPITNPAARFNFDPVNYTGDWAALNIPDKVCNPRGQIIFHQAIMAASSSLMHPERGVAFLHLRCDPQCTLQFCGSV